MSGCGSGWQATGAGRYGVVAPMSAARTQTWVEQDEQNGPK